MYNNKSRNQGVKNKNTNVKTLKRLNNDELT